MPVKDNGGVVHPCSLACWSGRPMPVCLAPVDSSDSSGFASSGGSNSLQRCQLGITKETGWVGAAVSQWRSAAGAGWQLVEDGKHQHITRCLHSACCLCVAPVDPCSASTICSCFGYPCLTYSSGLPAPNSELCILRSPSLSHTQCYSSGEGRAIELNITSHLPKPLLYAVSALSGILFAHRSSTAQPARCTLGSSIGMKLTMPHVERSPRS